MMAVLYILAMLLLFGLSIFVHELGHFLAARACGMVADVFSIGMGKAIWKRRVGGTSFQIGWLPIGGYVALPQMDPNSFLEGAPRENQRVLPRVAPGRKIIVSVAGAAGNLAFAFLLAVVVWIAGKPASLEERNGVVGFIATNSPALALGLAVGDEIIAVDGQPVANWTQILEKTSLVAGREVNLRIRPAAGGPERDLALATEKSELGLWLLPGIEGMSPCQIATVYPHSGAQAANLQSGDVILSLDGHKVYSQGHLSQLVEAAAGRPALLEYRRNGEQRSALVESRYDEGLKRHLIGIQFNTLADLDFAALTHPTPWAQLRGHATAIFSFLHALTTPATSGAAAGAVGGPVLILIMLWLMVKSSFILAIWFTGFLNVNLAILNLLPLPVLDGGHVVMNVWEMVTRRPAPPKLINALANVFAILFIALFLLLVFRDSVRHLVPPIQRWFSGERTNAMPKVFEQEP